MKFLRTFIALSIVYHTAHIHAYHHTKNEQIHQLVQIPQKSAGHEYSFGIIPLRNIHGIWQTLIICEESGRWSFPKGHIEDTDSSVIFTAERELFEETNLHSQHYFDTPSLSTTYISKSTGLEKTVTLFIAIVEGTLQLEDKAREYLWIDVANIQEKMIESYYQDLIASLQQFVDEELTP